MTEISIDDQIAAIRRTIECKFGGFMGDKTEEFQAALRAALKTLERLRDDFDQKKGNYIVALTEEPLSSVVEALRAIPGGEWGDGALEELRYIRHGPTDAEHGGI